MNSEKLIRFVRADGTESTGPVPDMMRAYAAAGFTGKLLPVTAPAPADDVVVAAPQPASPALRPGVDVDPEAARRIKAAESFLASRGFAAPVVLASKQTVRLRRSALSSRPANGFAARLMRVFYKLWKNTKCIPKQG